MQREIDDLKHEISRAGYELSHLLTSTLMPATGSWDGARSLYTWEHNALCWLWRNRQHIDRMCSWTSKILYEGYPFKQYKNAAGVDRQAGFLWNNTMAPLPNAEDRPNGVQYYA